MVELQRTHAGSGNDDLAVYALSYDPVSTLERFASAHGITYPLLSDEGSVAITDLGILNVTLEQERAAYGRTVEDRHRGIPYPGSFVLDADGVLVGKRFEQSHRIRPTANTLLSTFGGSDGSDPSGMVTTQTPGVQVAAWLDSDVVYANQTQNAHVRLVLDSGVHVYTDPVPDGFQTLRVQLGGDSGLRTEEATPLQGERFSITGLDEEFFVLDGTVDITVPFFLLTNRDTAGDKARAVPLTVEVSYQACTGDECYMPEAVSLELALTEEPNPGYETADPAALAPLVIRRIIEEPRTEDELVVLVNAALEGVEIGLDDIEQTLDDLRDRGLVEPQGGKWVKA